MDRGWPGLRASLSETPYPVTRWGNGRERTFFSDDDFALYRDLLGEAGREAKVGVWAWRLSPTPPT
jgi:putative transposase